jgi:UDP-2,3-diacylglucosamine hydrolase
MNDAVFISDLHLNQNQPEITQRFTQFVQWAAHHTKAVYILGDFFHAWAGDDKLDDWSESIASQLSWLAAQGVSLYYLHGNRDFLLGESFANRASLIILADPSIILLDNIPIALTHGDQYCTNDRAHQYFRAFTRHRLFVAAFLQLPYALRAWLVNRVRQHSQHQRQKPPNLMDIVPSVMLADMQRLKVQTLIHGHIHKPGLTNHPHQQHDYRQYVLSDWDDSPLVLCYTRTKGFSYVLLEEAAYAN